MTHPQKTSKYQLLGRFITKTGLSALLWTIGHGMRLGSRLTTALLCRSFRNRSTLRKREIVVVKNNLDSILCLLAFAGILYIIGQIRAELLHEINKCKMVQISQQRQLDALIAAQKETQNP